VTAIGPFLTICVPSRNRQLYFQETIRSLAENPRDDIEFVFADNSDDPDIMNAFMADYRDDARIQYLPSEPQVLSMIGNWERTLEAAKGRWVAVIGDDDYIDPDVAGILRHIDLLEPDCQTFAWNRLTYNWPGVRGGMGVTAIPAGCRIVEVPREELLRRTFGWENAGAVPSTMFSVYHGVVRRDLLEENRSRYGNRYFGHPNVDLDSALKTICNARKLILSERPFSVLGACPQSNSAAVGRPEEQAAKHAIFMAELGRNMDEDPHMKDFPFLSSMGVTASVATTQNWFKTEYGFRYEGWEENFARSCALDCQSAGTDADFKRNSEAYRAAFARWKGGRFLKHFNPVYDRAGQAPAPFTGVSGLLIHVEQNLGGAATPKDFYDAAAGLMTPPGEIPVELGVSRRPALV
jgi:glycosyltransferase involved in cell wall biosynthesis